MPGIPTRKIHKKLDMLPKRMQLSPVECGAEYPTVVTDNWRDATCPKCLLKKEEKEMPELKELTEEDWKNLYVKNICPDCGETEMLQGPRGGEAENIKCKSCDQEFWICAIPGEVRRI